MIVRLVGGLLVGLLPGYLLYTRCFYNEDDSAAELLSGAFLCSVWLLSTIGFAGFVSGHPTAAVHTALYGVLIVGLGAWRPGPARRDWVMPLVTFLGFNVLALLLLSALPSYQAAFTRDWSLYFPNVDVYLGVVDPSTVTDSLSLDYLVARTPFFSLVNAVFLSFGDRSYVSYQLVSLGLNSLVFWSIACVALRYYDRRTAMLCLSALPVIPLLFYGVVIPTPKFLTAFGVLTVALSYVRIRNDVFGRPQRRRLLLCALGAGTAYMSHQSSLLYMVPMVIDQAVLLVRRRGAWPWRPGLTAGALAGTVVVPWFVWTWHVFGVRRAYAPTYGVAEQHLTLGTYLQSRGQMFMTSAVMPQSLFETLRRTAPDASRTNAVIRFYWETFLGGMSISATLTGLLAWWPRRREGLPRGVGLLLGLIGLGALGCLLVQPLVDLEGHAANMFAPLAIVWFVALFGMLARARTIVRVLALVGLLFEFVLAGRLVYLVTGAEPKMFHYLSDDASWATRGFGWFALLVVGTLAVYWTCVGISLAGRPREATDSR